MIVKDTIFRSSDFGNFISISKKKSIKLINKISKSRNTRICLHKANNSSLHVMLIKFFKSKNNKLHYHKNKCEFYFVLNGKLNIKIKKNKKIENKILSENEMLFMNNKVIHSVNPLTDKVIFIEVRPGPFKKNDSILYKK